MAAGRYIGDFAQAMGCTPKTVRYYEALGLLAAPRRTESGYRLYAEQDAERLRFVLNAKALGLSLNEIREIVALWDNGTQPCERVSVLLERKLAALDAKIQEMVAFRNKLRDYKVRIDESARSPDVPCAHIAGVQPDQWTGDELTAAFPLRP